MSSEKNTRHQCNNKNHENHGTGLFTCRDHLRMSTVQNMFQFQFQFLRSRLFFDKIFKVPHTPVIDEKSCDNHHQKSCDQKLVHLDITLRRLAGDYSSFKATSIQDTSNHADEIFILCESIFFCLLLMTWCFTCFGQLKLLFQQSSG